MGELSSTVTRCEGCGNEFKSTDTRTSSFTSIGAGLVVEEYWHVDCWDRHEAYETEMKRRANLNHPQSN